MFPHACEGSESKFYFFDACISLSYIEFVVDRKTMIILVKSSQFRNLHASHFKHFLINIFVNRRSSMIHKYLYNEDTSKMSLSIYKVLRERKIQSFLFRSQFFRL